uniref:Uncharacterized protein n=1 Tax=Cacopsylla melanoneura TaxID=428564 RepID=A0A8D9FJ52_9HEMI
MQHPCLTPLPMITSSVSSFSTLTTTFCPLYNSLMSLLSFQLIWMSFSIFIKMFQLTRSNAFSQSMKQTYMSLFTSINLSASILTHPIASLVPFPFRNPN